VKSTNPSGLIQLFDIKLSLPFLFNSSTSSLWYTRKSPDLIRKLSNSQNSACCHRRSFKLYIQHHLRSTSRLCPSSTAFPMLHNDLPDGIIKLYADDVLLYSTITSPDDCHRLQVDLKILEQWAKKWNMTFNPTKCELGIK